MDLPNVNVRSSQRPSHVDQTGAMSKGQGVSSDYYTEIVSNVLTLYGLQDPVTVTKTPPNTNTGKQEGPTGVPSLDNPADLKRLEKDLEKLISYLQLDNDKRQTEMAKHRIEVQKSEVEERHTAQMEKLKESMDALNFSNGMGLGMKIFGWVMAAASIAMAVVASVATGGAAAVPIAAAVMSVLMATATTTGAMEKLTEWATAAAEWMGMSKDAAKIAGAIAVAVGAILLSLAVVGGTYLLTKAPEEIAKAAGEGAKAGLSIAANATSAGAKSGSNVATSALQSLMKDVQKWMLVGMAGAGLGGTIASGVASYHGYQAGLTQSELSEIEKFLAIMRQRVDESQEELEILLQQIQGTISNLIKILDSATDTQMEIAQQMGVMA